jgi:hypothetical protein
MGTRALKSECARWRSALDREQRRRRAGGPGHFEPSRHGPGVRPRPDRRPRKQHGLNEEIYSATAESRGWSGDGETTTVQARLAHTPKHPQNRRETFAATGRHRCRFARHLVNVPAPGPWPTEGVPAPRGDGQSQAHFVSRQAAHGSVVWAMLAMSRASTLCALGFLSAEQ